MLVMYVWSFFIFEASLTLWLSRFSRGMIDSLFLSCLGFRDLSILNFELTFVLRLEEMIFESFFIGNLSSDLKGEFMSGSAFSFFSSEVFSE